MDVRRSLSRSPANHRSWLHLDDRSRSSSPQALSLPAAGQSEPAAPAPASPAPEPRDAQCPESRARASGVSQGQHEVEAPEPVGVEDGVADAEAGLAGGSSGSGSGGSGERVAVGYTSPAHTSPGYTAPGYTSPGYGYDSYAASQHPSPLPERSEDGYDPYRHQQYVSAFDSSTATSPSPPSGHASPAAVEGDQETASAPAASARQRRHEFLLLTQTHFYFIPLAIFGTLARLGLTAITTYPGSPLAGVIWANFTGSLIMGFLLEDRKIFSAPAPGEKPATGSKAALPLYMGLTTGFCGSLTSFSSFQLTAFDVLANVSPAHTRDSKGYAFCAVAGYILATLALSTAGLRAGAHLAAFLAPATPRLPYALRLGLDYASVPVGLGCWAGAVAMAVCIPKWRADALFACVFAPLGVFVRFWASRWLNPLAKSFPLGTFAVNVAGSLLLAGLALGRTEHAGVGCAVIRGVADGFCGCLTTVSTFVVELRALRPGNAYLYGGASVAAGLAVTVLLLGSYNWSNGLGSYQC